MHMVHAGSNMHYFFNILTEAFILEYNTWRIHNKFRDCNGQYLSSATGFGGFLVLESPKCTLIAM